MGTQRNGTHPNGNHGEIFISQEPNLPDGVTEEERERERDQIARRLYDLRYQYRGYPDKEDHMSKREAIEFQQHMRSFGIEHLSPEMRERFDKEYQSLSAEEQRNGWDQVIESTARAHFASEDLEKYRRYQQKFKNKFADNWCMSVASWLEHFTDDDRNPQRDKVLQSLFSHAFRNRMQAMVSRLYNSLGQKENRSPRDIGEINAFLDDVLVQLYPEIKNRSAQVARARLEEIFEVGET